MHIQTQIQRRANSTILYFPDWDVGFTLPFVLPVDQQTEIINALKSMYLQGADAARVETRARIEELLGVKQD